MLARVSLAGALSVDTDLNTVEAFANASTPGTPQYAAANPDGAERAGSLGEPPLDALIRRLAARSLVDLRILRKLANADINRLELNLLRGDPLLAAMRDLRKDVLRLATNAKAKLFDESTAVGRSGSRAASGGGARAGATAAGGAVGAPYTTSSPASSAADSDATTVSAATESTTTALKGLPLESEQGLWLRAQFEQGAIPRDPLLVLSLLEQAKADPDLFARLVTEAKDANGQDLFTRVSASRGEAQVVDEDS